MRRGVCARQAAELKFLSEGFGVKRYEVMYNDFVVIGPKADPAHIAGGKDVADALRKIAESKAVFVSRGDRSGTHEAELRLWKEAGVDLGSAKGAWYREIGRAWGLRSTWRRRPMLSAVDRGTWLSFKKPRRACDPDRRRPPAVQPVRRDAGQSGQASRCESRDGQAFIDWLVAPAGKRRSASTGRRRTAIFPQLGRLAGNATVLTVMLSASRINPSPSASAKSPLLVSARWRWSWCGYSLNVAADER